MAFPKDSAFASQLPVLDLTEMNTLLQLSYVAQQCLYTGEAQPQEPKDEYFLEMGESYGAKDPTTPDIISWMPYEDHNYARPPPPLTQPNSSSVPDQMNIDDVSCHTTVTTTVTEPGQESWEGSVTRCICEFKHDDGYMICCDRCGVWQHVDCMGVERSNIPDVYLCELCEPRFVDKHNAIRLQTRKRELLQKMGNLTESDSDDDRRRSPKKQVGRKRHERRRTVSTSAGRGQKPGRVPGNQPEPTTAPVTTSPKNIFPSRRNSTRTSKAAETVARQPSPPALVSPVVRFAPVLEAPSNVYSQELLEYLAEHQRANGLERALTATKWTGPPTGEACAIFQVTPQIKGIKASRVIEANETIIEYTGNVMLRHEYQPNRSESGVLFYSNLDSRLDVCIGATTDDMVARFVRRSCTPNAVVKHIFDGRGEVHFCLCSSVVISPGSEITIPFDSDIKAGDTDVSCACGLASCLLLFQNNSSPRKSRLGKKTLPESNKVASVSARSLPSPPGVRGRRRHSTPFHSPEMDVKTSPDVGLLSSPAKVDQVQRSDHVRSDRMGRGRWNRTRSMNQSSQEPQPGPNSGRSSTENKDENRKLTREEKKLEAIMKAFEQIQKEGPKRPKELHPEKRSRKRSAKSESTESKVVTPESTRSKAVMSESKGVTSELTGSHAVMSESTASKAEASKSTESKAVMSESSALKAVMSESTESKSVTSESTESKSVMSESTVMSELTESKGVEDEDKGSNEEMSLTVKKEPPPGSVVDEEDAEKLVVNAGDMENRDTLVNLIDENLKTGEVDQTAQEKSEVKYKEEEMVEDGEWTNQVEENDLLRGDIEKSLIVENVKEEESEKKVEFEGVHLDEGDLVDSKAECEITVKKEEEEIPPEEDGRSESEHRPVEAEERPSANTPISQDPQKSGKCSEAVVTGELLSKEDTKDSAAMETSHSPERSEVRGETPNLERVEETRDETNLPLRRSKRRQPSGASQPELLSQTKDLETVVKEPSLDTIPDCGVPHVEENIEPPKESDTVVKPVVRSKGRPRKITTGQKVGENAGKEPDAKKPMENKFEHRVRTRSCTKEVTSGGVVTNKAKPLGRKCNPKLKKKVQPEQRQPSTARLAFSKTLKKILPCRKSARGRPPMVRVPPPQSTIGAPLSASVAGEPTTRSISLITSPDRSSGLLRTHKLLLSEAARAKLSAENPECTSSESDLEWTRGMLSPSGEALVTPVGSGASLNSSSNNATSPWSQLDSSLSHGSAKKRWLRQAINESVEPAQSSPVEPVASSSSSAETPLSPSTGFTTPLKKRRLTIESESTTGFIAVAKLTWSDEGRSDFFVQSPPEPRREIAELPFSSQSVVLSTEEIQLKDSETCKVAMDFDPSSRNSDSLLTISCLTSPIQPPDSRPSLKITDQFLNSSDQHASYTKPAELGSGEFNSLHAEPSSSGSYHCAGHGQDGGKNSKEPHELYDMSYTIKGSRGRSINALPLNTKTRWLATADKSGDHTRNSLSVPANNRSANTFSSTESVNETSDHNSLESVAKGNHQRGSQSTCSKRSSCEYEVSTTDPWMVDSRVNHENAVETVSKCPLRADQHVTCSSADDDREPVSETSRMEKEDGEITDDEPDNSAPRHVNRTPPGVRTSPGVTSSEISSTNFRWNHPYPPNYRGGRGWGWRGNSRGGSGPNSPFRFVGRGQRGPYWQRDPSPSPPKQPGLSEFKGHVNSCSLDQELKVCGKSCSPDREFKGYGKPCSPDREVKGCGMLCSPDREFKGKPCSPDREFKGREKSCSPDQEESHVDSSSAVSSGLKWKAKEIVVGSPITSDEDDDVGGNDSNHSSPFSRESDTTRFRARSRSPVCQKEEKKDEKCKEKELRRRSSSTSSFSSSSSDLEQRRSYQSHQQGTKKKMSLMEYRKRMKRRRKSVVASEPSTTKPSFPRENPEVVICPTRNTFEDERREIANAIQKLSSVPSVSTVSNCMTRVSVKSLSLTERLRYEFGVDASDETDAQPDGEDDDEPPPPPPPPPVSLPVYRQPHTTYRPPLPPSPEPPPPPPPADTPPPPPPPPPSNPPWPKLDRLVQGLGALLSSQSPGYSTSAWNVPENAGPSQGNGAKAHPTGVKVEYFASVRRQTPRPITPGSMRFSKNVEVPMHHTETSPAPVFGHELGSGLHPAESGSFVPTRARPNCGQNLPFVPLELHPSIPQHPRQPNVNLPGMDCTLPPHRGALPHGRPQGPPPGEIISGGCVDAGDLWPKVRRHQCSTFTETKECFPRTKAVPPPGDHEHLHAEDYHLEQPEDHRSYHGCSSFRPLSSATEEAEFDERQNWLPRRSWSKGHGQSSWADADVNGGRHGDEGDGQNTPRKVMPLMSIKSFPTRQFSDETLTSPQGPSSQSKRSQNWSSESWHDATQSDRASDANLTPSSANSESTNHDSLPMSAHDRTMDFADNSLDGTIENGPSDRPAPRTGSRSSSRSEFIRSSLERNRACQAILRKQMSDSL